MISHELKISAGTARNIDALYDRAMKRTKLAYPGASQVINYTYDANNRISRIKDGSNIVNEYKYICPSRVSERKYVKASDGSTEVTSLHVMYDGVAGITRFYHDTSGGTVRIGFKFGRDKVGNPNYELREHQSNKGDEYTYDNLYRLTRSIYDDSTPATPTASPAAASTDDFRYDDIGNRTKSNLKSANATTYLANAVNEYTKSTLDGTDTFYGSDAAGNLTRVVAARALQLEDRINTLTDEIHENHVQRLERGDCDVVAGVVFLELISNMEKVGDRLTNIAQRVRAVTESYEKAGVPDRHRAEGPWPLRSTRGEH